MDFRPRRSQNSCRGYDGLVLAAEGISVQVSPPVTSAPSEGFTCSTQKLRERGCQTPQPRGCVVRCSDTFQICVLHMYLVFSLRFKFFKVSGFGFRVSI